ncbi:HAMP domain-containing histidine kinase [Bacillus sp. A301a_S52]|nr:HAMP domain-containing histidine kinase [Bacillus sp. A301a_S52]
MSANRSPHKQSLLKYWTTRYVAAICIGLAVITLFSVLWIRHSAYVQKVDNLQMAAGMIAQQLSEEGEVVPLPPPVNIPRPHLQHYVYELDIDGNVLSSSTASPNLLFDDEFIDTTERVHILEDAGTGEQYMTVKEPITDENTTTGWVAISELNRPPTIEDRHEYGLLAVMIVSLGFIGWGAMYLLTKKLSKPIVQVADAAKHIQAGRYDVNLPSNLPQREMNELIQSFKKMAERLDQLESLRTQLLAGVTHELKTPVTSISGLLQAIQDGVVSENEAATFIRTALGESERLKTMISDLVEFNSFAVHDVPVKSRLFSLNDSISTIVRRFNMTQTNPALTIVLHQAEEDVLIEVDEIRLQQILSNILANSISAVGKEDGFISLTVETTAHSHFAYVYVEDNGEGIAVTDQPFVFERFYRGENKKYKERGFGIGLPLSQVLAEAMGGQLTLVESRPGKTVFLLKLVKKT